MTLYVLKREIDSQTFETIEVFETDDQAIITAHVSAAEKKRPGAYIVQFAGPEDVVIEAPVAEEPASKPKVKKTARLDK